MKIQVYDPPMCCSTGICGPSVDPELVRFAADMDWLKRQGVDVVRYNLSQQPKEFAGSALVKKALAKDGNDCLPLTVADGKVVCTGKYPTREMLAKFAGVAVEPTIFTASVRELVALGASVVSNCEPCFKHHYNEARKLGVSKDDMRQAIETAQMVKDAPANSIKELADKILLDKVVIKAASSCCTPSPLKKGGKGKSCC